MVEIGSQKLQYAASSDCRSFGSGHYQSGRFPKVSIGISVDTCSKRGPGLRKEDAAPLPSARRTFSCQGPEINRPGVVESLERNKSDDIVNHKASPWVSTRSDRSPHSKTPPETAKFFVNSASLLQPEDGVHNDFNFGRSGEKGGKVQGVEEVAFATKQKTQLADKGNTSEEDEKTAKSNEKITVTYGKTRKKGGDDERTEEGTFSTKQVAGEANGEKTDKIAELKNGSLKKKLWEILGSAPAENNDTMNSPNVSEFKETENINHSKETQKGKVRTKINSSVLEENKQGAFVKQSREFQKGKTARAKQNSDTIETGLESPSQVMRRPVTRSFTRKRAPPKRVQKLQGNFTCGKEPFSFSSDMNLKFEKRNIFNFGEVAGKEGSLGRNSSDHYNRSKEKINEQNNAKIEPRRISFPRSVPEKSLHDSDKEHASPTLDKASSPSKEKGNSSVPFQDKKQFMQTVDGTPNDRHQPQRVEQFDFGTPLWAFNTEIHENSESPLPKIKRHSWGHVNSPLESNVFPNVDNVCRSMGRDTNHFDDFHSPTLAVNMSPTPPSMRYNEVLFSSEAAQPRKLFQDDYSSEDLNNSSTESCRLEEDSEFSDDTIEIHKPRNMESPYIKEPEKQQFSPMEEHNTENEVDDLTSQGFGRTDKWFQSTGSPKESPVSHHHNKRIRHQNNATPSPIGTSRFEETIGSLDALKQFPEGSLARCVSQLALVLRIFKRRVKSHTSKRSSVILSAAADNIRQQLQDVESQILSNMVEFNNIGKSKRKRLESRFHEQQDNLKLIHDKFKEEVNQHLLGCRSILEKLEAYNIELKGTTDRQKASHRKLLLQVGEAMEVQINEAETRIAAIHKDSRKKMIGLKHVLKEWMD